VEYAPTTALYCIRIIKARRMRWVGHVTRMEEKRNAYRLLVGKYVAVNIFENKKQQADPLKMWHS
jgi:hypothetical protein